nr:hypothetical protein [uncultured Butyrivibrio sp.]
MNNEKVTILEEKTYPVQGTTKLSIYDPGYSQKGTDLEFFGNISAAPLGLLRIRKVRVECSPDEYFKDGLTYEEYRVDVFQGAKEEFLKTYAEGQYYPKLLKKQYGLNCETASFAIETKFNSDFFRTGADGVFAELYHMKQYGGMILHLYFDDCLFTFDELESRFLKLFKERKTDSKTVAA